jgi:hypothetical protein
MPQTWKYALALGFVAATLSAACTVSSDDDDSTGGTGGTSGTGGVSGTGGTTGGTGGSGGTSGAGGTSGTGAITPTCDPSDSTPNPSCAPGPDDQDDECALCVQSSCCEESKACYGTNPYNVCGWGGPSTAIPDMGVVTGLGEIGCFTTCLGQYVNDMGVCDSDGIDNCASACATDMCGGLPGDATNDLATCMQTNCAQKCFGADACDAG